MPWVKTLDLRNGEISATDECVTNVAVQETSLQVYPPGTVLVAMYGGFNQIGRTGLLRIPACVNQALSAIQVNRNRVVPEYLLAVLNFRVEHWKAVASSSRKDPNITGNDVRAFELPLPSIEEQRSIAVALSDIDALLAKLDQLIAKKRDLKQAAMQQLLTGRRRLPGFTEPWRERTLQSAVARLEAGVSVRSVEGDVGSSDCFVLKTSAVADGNFDASERKPVIPADRGRVRCPVRAGTVLVSRMNTPDLVGEVGFVDRDHPNSFLPDRLWAASVPKGAVSARWLSYVLSSSEYKQRLRDVATGTSGSMKNISKGAFLGISVKVPTLDEQVAIAQVLSDMDAELAALEARRDKTRQLKQGMMQALLTGRIRLT